MLVIILLVFFEKAEAIENKELILIYKTVRCAVCQGESVYDSRSGFAEMLRDEIRNQYKSGKTRDLILRDLVKNYGEKILNEPSNTILWEIPIIAFFAILILMYSVFFHKKDR